MKKQTTKIIKGETPITLCMDSFSFAYIWSIATKKGGNFNDFLIDYYIEKITNAYPEAEKVIIKIFIENCNLYGLTNILTNGFSKYLNERELNQSYSEKLRKNFFVLKKEIINPIEVGI